MSLMIRQLLRRLVFRRTEQNPRCAILQLPIEMILLISEYLSEYERIILVQTCSSLRIIFIDNYKGCENSRHPLSSGQLDIDQRSRFIHTLAYRQPKLLACYWCLNIHTIDKDDIPSSQRKFHCRHKPEPPSDYFYWFGR